MTSFIPPDHAERELATDPRFSLIVQAPAGSGKTEILTQRYLRLLQHVETPEQIIALTFTKKAANEMRERIVAALTRAAKNIAPASAHQAQTTLYARNALARDQHCHWQLLTQPSRLRVITLDALCHMLMHAMPEHEAPFHAPHISEHPHRLYLEAARACLQYAFETQQPALKQLLEHLDNRQDKVLNLFCNMLAQRDQWLPNLYQAKTQTKTQYETALADIEHHELLRFQLAVPADLQPTLVSLSQSLASIEANIESKRHALVNWNTFTNVDRTTAQALCALLLTSQNTLRKAFDHHVGLKRDACPSNLYNTLKAESKALLSALSEHPDVLESLIRIKHLPEPRYEVTQWLTLQALFELLPILVAHLNMVMHDHNTVDFTAIAHHAATALGDSMAPSELALRLDHGIMHLLVDEFQDTSIQQFQLLEKLISGWEPGDGRTLFVVGDPMQSIYRFRSAEVGLFLRARQYGMGPVHLKPLTLRCNFRSTTALVEWINAQFTTLFPARDDIESGAVSYQPCTARHETSEAASVVDAEHATTPLDEGLLVLARVKETLERHPDDTLAILVRTRRQLRHVLRLFRENNVAFQGIDIDLIAHLPHLRDVWSITTALLKPAHRLAWLSLLRSPWCGLSLHDLHCIANIDPKGSVFFALAHVETTPHLSAEGRQRALFIYSVFKEAYAERHQSSLIDWILTTLKKLHLESILESFENEELEQYWTLLETFERDGLLSEWALFQKELNRLYSKKVTPARVQIMTIHKAKGLEFDHVFLPGLSAISRSHDAPLLRWLKLPSEHGECVLISPIKAASDEKNELYDYLAKLDAEKNHYEAQRLLYVAITRAKKHLYLFDHQPLPTKGSFRAELSNVTFESATPTSTIKPPTATASLPKHLPLSFYPPRTPSSTCTFQPPNQAFQSSTPRLVGIVTHELLQWICTHHPQTKDQIPWHLAADRFKALGFEPTHIEDLLHRLHTPISRLFDTSIGTWIIAPHEKERNEYALQTLVHNQIVTRIVDRTFEDQGKRWIIDFKTGHVDHEAHQQQVNAYAALFKTMTALPIYGGLYYVEQGDWISWPCFEEDLLCL